MSLRGGLDPFGFVAHLIVYGETPATTLRETLSLLEELESTGRMSSAREVRNGLSEGVGVGPLMRKQLRRNRRSRER